MCSKRLVIVQLVSAGSESHNGGVLLALEDELREHAARVLAAEKKKPRVGEREQVVGVELQVCT